MCGSMVMVNMSKEGNMVVSMSEPNYSMVGEAITKEPMFGTKSSYNGWYHYIWHDEKGNSTTRILAKYASFMRECQIFLVGVKDSKRAEGWYVSAHLDKNDVQCGKKNPNPAALVVMKRDPVLVKVRDGEPKYSTALYFDTMTDLRTFIRTGDMSLLAEPITNPRKLRVVRTYDKVELQRYKDAGWKASRNVKTKEFILRETITATEPLPVKELVSDTPVSPVSDVPVSVISETSEVIPSLVSETQSPETVHTEDPTSDTSISGEREPTEVILSVVESVPVVVESVPEKEIGSDTLLIS